MTTVVWERDRTATQAVYFAVSIPKLVVMSLFTFGLYDYYWFYKNWKLVQARSGKKMMPFWRAFFSVVWAQSLFDRIARRAQDEGIRPGFSPSPMAGLFILLTLSVKLPDPYWLVSFLAFLPVVRVHRTAIAINRRVAPDAPVNAAFTAWNILGIVVVGVIVLAAVLAAFLLPEQG